MRQKIRKTLIFISLLLFPITMNFMSPYLPVVGGISGIIVGSIIIFFLLFITALFFGRAWCSWVCPIAGLSEACLGINNKNVNAKKLKIIRYTIFAVWIGFLIFVFSLASGIKGIEFLFLTETGVSVDSPMKYIIYYGVLGLFFIATIFIGKRGACHSFCWMSPFLVGGLNMGRILKIPHIIIKSDNSKCVKCGICNKKCPMSVNVSESVQKGLIKSSDCILCGECVDNCNRKALRFGVD